METSNVILLVFVIATMVLPLAAALLFNSYVLVEGTEIAVLERRWIGRDMPPGRVIAQRGEVGVQAQVLGPGFHWLIPFVYPVEKVPMLRVTDESVGLVEAIDGRPQSPGQTFGRLVDGHDRFQDAEQFLRAGGQRGPQLDLIPPGLYRVNPRLFRVMCVPVTTIPEGRIGVVNATDGAPLAPGRLLGHRVTGHGNFEDGAQFIAAGGERGPQIDVLLGGRYRVNTWRIGTIENLISHVIHPLIDSSFRNQASSSEAMKFMQDRHEEQRKAEIQIARELERYHVLCVSVLICQIVLPERLMETLTNKVVATQQMSMFDAQRQAEDRRREMENTRAQADMQPSLVRSEVDVQIAAQRKQEAVLLAEGAGEATRLGQEGIAAGVLAVGKAQAERIRATGVASAETYALQAKALGQAPVALIEVMRRVADGHVKITPDVVVSSAEGKAESGFGTQGMLAVLMGRLIAGAATSSGPTQS